MPNEKFINGLKDLGHTVEILGDTRIIISNYLIEEGRLKGQTIKVGFEVPPDFEITPPTGPHITPCLLTINESATTHPEKVVASPFGPEWQYLSRPYPNNYWPNSARTVKEYMRHIKHILNTL